MLSRAPFAQQSVSRAWSVCARVGGEGSWGADQSMRGAGRAAQSVPRPTARIGPHDVYGAQPAFLGAAVWPPDLQFAVEI